MKHYGIKQYLEWIKTHVHFDQPALEATLLDYLHEVEHVDMRIVKLEKAIDEAVPTALIEIRGVIEALQALRGVAQTTAATIVSELGSLSRFQSPRQLMGYSVAVWWLGSIPVAIEFNAVQSPRQAMPTYEGFS
jgi:transposase